jgi:hypothetical protein
MQTWVAVFIVFAAIAVVLQAIVFIAFFFLIRTTIKTAEQTLASLDAHVSPLLSRLRTIVEESNSDLRNIVRETAEVARTVRANSQRFDRLLEDATDRLRLQIIHADRLLTGAFEAVEDTGNELRKSVIEPVRTVAAFVKGVRAGVDFFRGRSRIPERRREAEDEGLFV